MDWLVWVVVIIVAILWFAGREESSRGPSPTGRQDHPSPPPQPTPPPPPTTRDVRREREDEAFADGAVFAWFAYHEWFADSDGDPDAELTDHGLYSDDLDDDLHDPWDEFDDGFGF